MPLSVEALRNRCGSRRLRHATVAAVTQTLLFPLTHGLAALLSCQHLFWGDLLEQTVEPGNCNLIWRLQSTRKASL
jgi:hypothetical protein